MSTGTEGAIARARAASGVLFLDEAGRVLLVVPSYKDSLDIPGGCVEHGETPRGAAVREVREELSIEPPVGRLLVADWWLDSPDPMGGPKALFVFDGGTLAPEHRKRIRADGTEVVDFRFHPPADLDDTVERMARHWQNLLRAMIDDPGVRLSELAMLDRDEIAVPVPDVHEAFDSGMHVHTLFERQAAATPDALAVTVGGCSLSYAALNARANRIAHRLRALGVGPEVRVGLVLHRSLDLVAAVLAVLKAGGAYVPLDPTYPLDRLQYMLSDCAPSWRRWPTGGSSSTSTR